MPFLTIYSFHEQATSSMELAVAFSKLHKLIPTVKNCHSCGLLMTTRADKTKKPGYRFCCKCGIKTSPLQDTWFQKSKLSLETNLKLLYMWSHQFSSKQVVQQLEVSKHTVADYFSFCREILQTHYENNSMIGGPGTIVEIDEAVFGRAKYHRGRHRALLWVLGGIQRHESGKGAERGKIFIEIVRARQKIEILPQIMAHVAPGTTIYTDCWPGYKDLPLIPGCQYNHAVVNHSKKEFVHPENPQIHTQNIENL
jgi:ISXO2-like transposase domain